MVELTSEQKTVHDAMIAFAQRRADDYLTVGGYAGTGKTTLLGQFLRSLRDVYSGVVVFCCFTGKASSVLRGKLEEEKVLRDDYCGTIHGLMYSPIDPNNIAAGWIRRQEIPADLVVVDEASMVNGDIWNDLRSYGVPVIAVGDHGQLPPVEGKFNLMEKPHHTLTQIHRQAKENPIIRLATMARETGEIEPGVYGKGIFKGNFTDDQIIQNVTKYGLLRSTLFLCGFNTTRVRINKKIRAALGATSDDPAKGDKVICLRNNRSAKIYNGMTGTLLDVKKAGGQFLDAKIQMDDGVFYKGYIFADQFNFPETIKSHPTIPPNDLKDLFDFGYCLTVHKAQGSEAESVVLFEERSRYATDEEWRKWLYTGITRAKTYLTIVNRRFTRTDDKTVDALDKGFQDAMLAD